MENVFQMLNFSNDNKIFRGYTPIVELYNALEFITVLFFIQNILTINLGVAFLKSVSIASLRNQRKFCVIKNNVILCLLT